MDRTAQLRAIARYAAALERGGWKPSDALERAMIYFKPTKEEIENATKRQAF